jgi:hypothetical protein
MDMDTISRNVDELAGPDRAALEHVIGRPLQSDQQVVIAILPKSDDAALARTAARARILATLQSTADHATAGGVTPALADQMVAEAMAVVRPRASSP